MKIHNVNNKLIAILGMGRTGLSTAKALIDSGANVIAWDDNPKMLLQAKKLGIEIADFRTIQWLQVSSLVVSPGIPLTGDKKHWSVELARKCNVEIIGDIELFVRERRFSGKNSPFVAVTGTNGKSTTVALIAHILFQTGYDVQLGGNIGQPVMNLADFSADRFYIIECSSYQIETTPTIDPCIGVLLNISDDHLDRHCSLENYIDIKTRVLTTSDHPIICVDDPLCEQIASDLSVAGRNMTQISFSRDEDLLIDQSYIRCSSIPDMNLDFFTDNQECPIQSMAVAIAVCMKLGLYLDDIKSTLPSFKGLTHRLQKIAQLGEVIFINDSKSTNINSVIYALLKEKCSVYWIAGGISKSNDFSLLAPVLSKIAKAYLIGESADLFAHNLKGKVPFEISKTLDQAVANAVCDVSHSTVPSVILFSPGCASFDQYKDFRERGIDFISQVSEIKGIKMLVNLEKERQCPW